MAGTSSCLPQLFRRKSEKLQSGKNQDSYVKHKAPDNSPNKLSSRSGGSGRNSFSSQRNSFSSQTSRHSDSPSKNDKPRECLSKSSSGGSVRSTLTSQTSKHSDASSKQQEDKTADNLAKSTSGGYGSSFLVFMELRKRITTFRDIFDIPPLNGSVPIQELIISTAEDLHRMYPEFVPFDPKIYERNTHQGLICFYEVLKCVGDSAWIDDPKVREKFRHSNVEQLPFEELTETVVTILDCINKAAKERFDNLADEDELKKDYGSQSIPIDKDKLSEPQSPEWKCNGSPPTPTSVLPASPKFGERESQNYSPPHLWDLRVQSLDKLNLVDWKRLSFHMILQNSLQNQANKDAKQSNRPNANVRGSLSLPGRMEEAKDGNDVLISEEPNTKESTAKRPGHMIVQAEGNKEPTAPIESLPNLESADLSGQSHDSQAQTTESTQKAERDNEKVGESPPPPPTEERVQSEEKTSPQHPPPPPSNVTPSSPQQTLPPPLPPTGEMPPSSTTQPPPPAPIDNATPLNPSNDNSTNTKPPPPPPSNATTPPPPPPPGAAPPPPPPGPNGGPIAPPAPTPSGKGGGQPPPPPASGKTLRRINTKLKRSSQMGNLYRLLKGKVEGSSLTGKSSQPRKASANNAAGGGQSMADALAEMTKRSAYFQQIEEDVQKHANSIKEMQKSLNSFQIKDMDELLQFHQEVESKLEVLTDESQVLSRFEGFPMKKLETLRMATALYTKLNGILSELQSWKIESPLGQLLEKVERYFTKLKAEMEALERTKDEEAKKFQSHNIHFDFGIFVKIKEAMVDVSSGCMELALKERREAKAATSDQTWSKPGGQKKVCAKMLWRAFQLAFKVYSFAGGQDDRADNLTKELAREIETDPMQD